MAIVALVAMTLAGASQAADDQAVHMANGIKFGEATTSSVIVWTRLTQNAERNLQGVPWGEDSNVPPGSVLSDMVDAVPGALGEVRIEWSLRGDPVGATDWLAVNPDEDYIRQVILDGLEPGEAYEVEVSSRSLDGRSGQSISGRFRTVPLAGEIVKTRVAVVGCQEFRRRDDPLNGHAIYQTLLGRNPDFFVHTGDIIYYDHKFTIPKAQNTDVARYKWNRMYALPFQRSLHNTVTSYFMKDDHDLLKNDCWPGQTYGDLAWEEGLRLFREQLPVGDRPYRTLRWGKDLQIWLVEGREFRSPNDMPDGPGKTIWGEEQKEWFFRTVEASDAAFRVLISPTPIVGPDRSAKNDNHANSGFTHEGDELRSFIGQQKNMYVVCGDRHWQYVSVDPVSGTTEFSVGSATEEHAGGFSQKDRNSMHRYLNIVGGFMEIEVERLAGKPVATFRHHAVDGTPLNEVVFEAE